jgi:DNA-binding XRE family transcriptional regulator
VRLKGLKTLRLMRFGVRPEDALFASDRAPIGVSAGLTQEQLSFRAGLSRPYVSMLERDLKSPTLETLFLLCEAMGISTAALVGRVERGRGQRSRPS